MIHLAQEDRAVDLTKDRNEALSVQTEELRLSTCLQVILNAGWSITKENWEDMLEVSGIDDVRAEYWELYNKRKQELT